MTSVTIDLPDGLAEEARRRGLLSSEFLTPLLTESVRIKSGAELGDLLSSHPATEPEPSSAEIRAMIAAARRRFRTA